MSALDGNTWGLGRQFDLLSERLFAIANKQGVRLSMKVKGNPRRFILPVTLSEVASEGSVIDEKGRVLGRLRTAKPAKKKAAKK